MLFWQHINCPDTLHNNTKDAQLVDILVIIGWVGILSIERVGILVIERVGMAIF